MTTDGQAYAVFGAVTALGIYQGFVPPLSEIRDAQFPAHQNDVRDLRFAQITASLAIMAIGLATSATTDSVAPTFVSAVMVGALAAVYEYALRAQ